MIRSRILHLLSLGAWLGIMPAMADDKPVPVTVENFARAESDLYFSAVVKRGGFGKFDHAVNVTPLDEQAVIRLNRDTLYSSRVFDLDAGPATITLPDTKGRFISMQVISEDQHTVGVYYEPGDYEEVRALQQSIKATQASDGIFEVPNWDMAGQKKVRDALNVLADTLPDRNGMFGAKGEIDPLRYLLGAASAWGGNPDKDAMYLNVFPEKNDGKVLYRITVKDVPVRDFWSISVYNAEGYYEKNDEDIYTVNNLTAVKNDDGSVTVQFGGQQGDAPNVIPVMPGWNYMVRLYRPAESILKGEWKFPVAEPVE